MAEDYLKWVKAEMVNFRELCSPVRVMVKKWEADPINIHTRGYNTSYYNIGFTSYFGKGYNNLALVEKIDKLELSGPAKIVFYALYSPNVTSFDELVDFFKDLDIDSVILELIKNGTNAFRIKARFFQLFFAYKEAKARKINLNRNDAKKILSDVSYNYNSNSALNILLSIIGKMLYSDELEDLENILKLNYFLLKAEDDENFNNFYQNNSFEVFKDGKFNTAEVFLYGGFFKTEPGAKEYYNSIRDIYYRFARKEIGSLGKGINKGMKVALKELPKSTYSKITKLSISGRKIESLNVALDSINGEEIKPYEENLNILIKIALSKLSEVSEFSPVTSFVPLANHVRYPISVKDIEAPFQKITKIIVKNSKDLTGLQIIATILAVGNRKFWARTGNISECANLLVKLFEHNPVSVVKYLEHLAFFGTESGLTLTQWNKTMELEDTLDIIPSLGLSIIDDGQIKQKKEKPAFIELYKYLFNVKNKL